MAFNLSDRPLLSGGDAATQLRAILGQSTWSPAERVAVASVQVLQPEAQELLRLALAVNEVWLSNDVSTTLTAAAAANERVAGYSPAALGLLADAFNALMSAVDVPLGAGLPTPRQVIMRILQQVEE